MLSRLLIKNFQVHEKLDLRFGPTVTTIVGSTDAGKSAILRALRFTMTNKPSGSAFIRTGSKTTEVKIQADGERVRRLKGKENSYELHTKKGKEEYKAFGTDVPEAIANLFNVSEVNFQGQHDAPFWLSLSAGQVSKALNEIVNLNIIDETLSRAGKEVKNSKLKMEWSAGKLKEAEQAEASLRWALPLEKRMRRLRKLEKELHLKSQEIDSKALKLSEVKVCEESRRIAGESLSDGQTALKTGQKVLKLGNRLKSLESLVKRINEAERYTRQKRPTISQLERLHASLQDNTLDLLSELIEKISRTKEQRCDIKDQLEKAKQKVKREFKGVCPVCGSKTKS